MFDPGSARPKPEHDPGPHTHGHWLAIIILSGLVAGLAVWTGFREAGATPLDAIQAAGPAFAAACGLGVAFWASFLRRS